MKTYTITPKALCIEVLDVYTEEITYTLPDNITEDTIIYIDQIFIPDYLYNWVRDTLFRTKNIYLLHRSKEYYNLIGLGKNGNLEVYF